MIPLSKQQCGNCRNGRYYNDDLACHHISRDPDVSEWRKRDFWCSGWELHPDYYEVFGFPSEAEQLEQQRMLMFPGQQEARAVMDGGFNHEITYD